MRVTIAGRHMDVSDELKAWVEKKVKRFPKFYSREPLHCEVVLDNENESRKAVEIKYHSGGKVFVAKYESVDFSTAIDKAVEKMEHQLRRFEDKISKHKGRE